MRTNRVTFLNVLAICLTLVCAFQPTGRVTSSPAATGGPTLPGDSPRAPGLTVQKALVLLADFNDTTPTYTAASFESTIFSTTSSSVRKYFREASFNNFDIVPAEETCGSTDDGVVGWTELGYNHPDTRDSYGADNATIVRKILVANDGCIDFSIFDTNGNNLIENSELTIIVVVAGYEASYSLTYTPSVWVHQNNLSAATGGVPQLDGKYIGSPGAGSYIQIGEVHRSTAGNAHQATIGRLVHEFGHRFNWPELTGDFWNSYGVGSWSVMGSGYLNGITYEGDSPAYPDAFLKWYQGWLTPTVVSGTLSDQPILPANANPEAYLLRTNLNGVDWLNGSHTGASEYFLVENRQNNVTAGYDAALPGCGLLIWHVDEAVIFNSPMGSVSHPLIWPEQADGLNELAGSGWAADAGDPWPGSGSAGLPKYDFNSSSTPNSNLYTGSGSLVSVHVDTTPDCSSYGSIQADLTYSIPVYAPFAKSSPANTATSQLTILTLDWADLPMATSYHYCLDAGSPDGDCDSGWVSAGTASQVKLGGLTAATTYEWQVQADYPGGPGEANSGNFWTFTTEASAMDKITNLPLVIAPLNSNPPPPSAFGKLSPANETPDLSIPVTLDWSGATGADSYEYCYDLTLDGDCTGTWTSSGTASQVEVAGLSNSTAYEWQVRAVNSGGMTYANGITEWNFTTITSADAWTTIAAENFEGTFPQPGWSRVDASSMDGGEYLTAKRDCYPTSGSFSGWMIGGGANGGSLNCGDDYLNNQDTWFIFGPFSTLGANAAQLTYQYQAVLETNIDKFYVTATDNPSAPWSGNTVVSDCYWTCNGSLNLGDFLCGGGTTSCLGLPAVYVAFRFKSDTSVIYTSGVMIDDIVLRKCMSGTCPSSAPPLITGSLSPANALVSFLDPFLVKLDSPLGVIHTNQ